VRFNTVPLPPCRLLDPAAVRRRRLALGISEKDLAGELGVSVSSVCGIESGVDQRHYDVPFVLGLAEALSVSLEDLLTTREAPARGEGTALVAKLGALLAAGDAPVPIEAVCDALACGLADLSDAVDELERRLDGTGVVLHRFDGQISLQPGLAVDTAGLAMATRAAVARSNLASDRLSMLIGLCDRSRQIDPRFADPWVSGQLANAGLIERGVRTDGFRQAEVTEDVRFSLMLDEAVD